MHIQVNYQGFNEYTYDFVTTPVEVNYIPKIQHPFSFIPRGCWKMPGAGDVGKSQPSLSQRSSEASPEISMASLIREVFAVFLSGTTTD